MSTCYKWSDKHWHQLYMYKHYTKTKQMFYCFFSFFGLSVNIFTILNRSGFIFFKSLSLSSCINIAFNTTFCTMDIFCTVSFLDFLGFSRHFSRPFLCSLCSCFQCFCHHPSCLSHIEVYSRHLVISFLLF